MIEPARISVVKNRPPVSGRYVLYWMQASQRARHNPALEYAARQANDLQKPLLVFFGLTGSFPEANLRHYAFMLDGLRETHAALHRRGIQLVLRNVSPDEGAAELSRDAVLTVVDRGYLKIQNQWRARFADRAACPVVQVESDVVVPVDTASPHEEFSAATFRPKVSKHIDTFVVPLKTTRLKRDSLGMRFDSLACTKRDSILDALDIDRSVKASPLMRGGTAQAEKHLSAFIDTQLEEYADRARDPSHPCRSLLGAYLHFGQISPVFIALSIKKSGKKGAAAYLEELIVRRELSMNFAHYNRSYDSYECLPAWALQTLDGHARDTREPIYPLDRLERAQTHDRCWNAAQQEMVHTGYMHGYMRMYWGKKILEWSPSPKEAFDRALYLNNRYQLDGRDPNSFAGVAWCFGKHDRPWKERPVFGKVRYMNEAGLRRKFAIDDYIERVHTLCSGKEAHGR